MTQRQLVPVKFGQGIDTKTDQKAVIAGKLTELENGVFTKPDTIGLRNGYAEQANDILSGGTITAANRLATFSGEILEITNTTGYSYSDQSNKWVDKGSLFNVDVSSKGIASANNVAGLQAPDSAKNGNYRVYAWNNYGDIVASVEDITTGLMIHSQVTLGTIGGATNRQIRCISFGTYLWVLWVKTADIVYRRIDITNPTAFAAEATLVAGNVYSNNDGMIDVTTDGTNAVVIYRHIADNLVTLKEFDTTGTVLTTFQQAGTSGALGLSICRDVTNSNIYCSVIRNPGGTQYFIVSNAFASVLGLTTIDATYAAGTFPVRLCSIGEAANSVRIFWDYAQVYTLPLSALNSVQLNMATVNNVGGFAATIPLLKEVGVASKPWRYDSKTYLTAKTLTTLQSTYFVVSQDGDLCAKSQLNSAVGLNITPEQIPNAVTESAGIITVAELVKGRILSVGLQTLTTNNVANIGFDFVHNQGQNHIENNRNLMITGGFLSMYDGDAVVEHGFHKFPEGIVLAGASVGGAQMVDGVYTYYVVYEWIDSQGNIHRSSPSTGTTINLTGSGGTGQVTVSIPTLRITAKNNVAIKIYRTTNAGTIPYSLPLLPSAANNRQNPQPNNKTVDYIDFLDQSADASITAGEILYTTGGTLENIAPPAAKNIDFFKNRIVLSGLEGLDGIWFSKYVILGEGIGFSDSFTINLDGTNYAKTLDDKLIFFKNSEMYALFGDGPLDTGLDNNFTVPQRIAADVGSDNARSCVLMPYGLMFKSAKGIYLLDRALNVKYIGAEVEAYNAQTITSATLVDTLNQVRFLTDAGVTLVYDYFMNQWSTFTNHTGKDSVIWNGTYTYLRTDAKVWKETPGTYTDNATEIVLKATTAWIKVMDMQGFQRAQRFEILGNYYSAHILTVKVATDYKQTYDTTLTANTATFVGADNVYQFRGHIPIQKCEAIRFQMYGTATGAPGRGFDLNQIMLQVIAKGTVYKLPAAKSV